MKNSYLKKVVALIITIAMILPMFPVISATASSQFVDFPTGWSYEAMTAAVSNGLINGRTPTTIEPQGNLTRAEMATVINRAFGATKTKDISSYSDVKPSDWFYTEIAKAVNMQTFQGDASGLMRPNDPITREEVFAVIARALVLETSDYSALSSHPDGYVVSGWAKPYASILSAKNYINGDENGYLNPKSNITREEFAQIMHNIIKTYYTSAGTYSKAGNDSALIRTSGVILRDVTIDGDLIIGDGVGYGSVVLENVIIKGRLLARGGEDSVRLVNTKVGENIVVKDVNGVVHFDNYKSEDAFKNINEITKATFKGDNYNISIGGSSSSSSKSYTISVTGAGVNISDSVAKGSTYTLPTPNMSNYPGFAGWRDNYGIVKNAGDSVIVTEDNDYVAVFTYKIKYYKQNLAKNAFIPDESLTVTRYDTKDKIVSSSRSDKQRTFTGFTYSEPHSVTSTTVNTSGTAEIKLYYTRNDIAISYSFRNGGAFTDGQPHNTTVVYGSDFTLPLATEVENGFDTLRGWWFNGTTYTPGATVTIEGYDPEGGWVFIAIWDTTDVYTVKFVANGYEREFETPAGTNVPKDFIDSLPPLWEVTGYVKDSRISPILYGAGNEYTHTVKYGWFYNPSVGIWQRFSHNVSITDEIVDSSGVLTVKEKSPRLTIGADVEKIGPAFDFQIYYEPKVVTVDGSGNTTVTGTRFIDTLKDYLWAAFSERRTPLQNNLQGKIETATEKAFVKLRDKDVLDADNNILPIDVFVRYSQIIGEQELEDYIVDNAKETLKNNDELKDAIFEYFESMANSSDPDDKSEIKGLFREAIDIALESDSAASEMVKDICEEMLDDPEIVKKALKDYVGYDVVVSDADLVAPAKESVIKWTKELIETDAQFRENVKDYIVNYIIDKLKTDDAFFADVVHYNFAGTPFEDISKPDALTTTTQIVIDIVENEFGTMSPDEVAVELGYNDIHDLFINRKGTILEVLIDDLNDETFFNTVISTTDFEDYSYQEIKNSTTHDIIIDFIEHEIDAMSDGALADFAGFTSVDEMLDEAKEKIAEMVVDDIKDTSKTAYDEVVEILTGNSIGELPAGITSIELFKLMLEKVVDEAVVSRDYEELEKMTGKDFNSMSASDIQDFFNNFQASLSDDDIVDEYLLAASYGKFTLDTASNPSASLLPADTREMIAEFVKLRFENDRDATFEELGYTDSDIIDEAKAQAKEKSVDKIEDPTDSFLVDQIKEHIGVEYADYGSVPQNAFDLVVDVVENKVNDATDIDDDFAHELGYTNADTLFDAIRDLLIESVTNKISTDVAERNKYIKEYSGIDFADPIEENAMDFIVQYALAVLNPMTYEEIKAELISIGYTEEEIDDQIESYIEENIETIINDEFGYCPANIDTMNTKQFIIELVLYLFDNDPDKRNAIIESAIDTIVESGNLDDFEDYIDHAIEHLTETGELDSIIDEIIESRYRATLDTMVHQLTGEENFEIAPSNSFILSAFEMQVLNYTFDELVANVPDKLFRIYPRERLEQIYTRAYNELLDAIALGKAANARGETAVIPSGLTFVINPVDDIYVIFRDRFVELVDSRATSNYYYSENEYLQELIRLTEVQNIFDTNTGVGTGYAIKEYRDYYDLILKLAIIGDDAMVWYTEELSQDELDQLILDYEDLFVKYANLLSDILYDYADTGSLPGQANNQIVNAIRNEIVSRLGSVHDKVLDWYKASPFNKEYSEDDYVKLKKVVRKAFGKINATTDEAIDLANKAYTLIDNKFDGLSGVDQITQIDADTYEVTIKGKTIRVERIDADTYKLTVSGKTINISRLENGNRYEITKGSDIIKIYREIAE